MSIDDKLKKIKVVRSTGVKLPYFHLNDQEIAQIHKVFSDEGYLHIPSEMGMDNFFTGKQWYDRFLKYLSEDMQNNSGKTDLLWAAKKAAGLE